MTRINTPRRRWWLLALLAAIVGGTLASARAADRATWDFTLPTIEGDRFVQVSKLPGPVLVNFWGRDCPPCVAELPLLQVFARANRGWTILLVCTDPPQDARVFLEKHNITLLALKSGASVEGLMRAAGNRSGGLPFTVVLRDGQVCKTHEGGLSEADLEALRLAYSSNEARP
jgi:outer membrane receptor for ferrienterochelin and colicins